MFDSVAGLVSGFVGKTIDKIWPDANAKLSAEEAKQKLALAMMQGQMEQELRVLQTQMSAILAEAQSADPWTSRARPSFLYVVYVILLAAIPMGIVSAVDAGVAERIVAGAKGWWAAIPSEMLTLFGVGYLGYAGARTVDKIKKKS